MGDIVLLRVCSVREKAAVSRRAKDAEGDTRLNFEMWKASREIARQCHEHIKKANVNGGTTTHPNASKGSITKRTPMLSLCVTEPAGVGLHDLVS